MIQIISGHPNLKDSKFSATLIRELQKRPDVTIQKLADRLGGKNQFDFSSEIKLLETTKVTYFLFPLYWYGPPSLLQKWIEDVLLTSSEEVKSVLSNKEIGFIISTGGSSDDYCRSGKNFYSVSEFISGLTMTFKFFGARVLEPNVFYATWEMGSETIEKEALKI